MSPTIESILVPTDGSEGARRGTRRGIDLAATVDADLHVLSVADTDRMFGSPSAPSADDRRKQEQRLEDEARRATESAAGLARTHLPGRITTAVERGTPFQAINEYVDSHDVDLIVMGTEGTTGLERVLLGSVTEKTLRTASVPVVTVAPTADVDEVGNETYEDVLVPTDDSEGAQAAIEWGITLAGVYDATMHTLYSVETSRFGGTEGAAEMHEALEQTGRDALETVRERARAAGISVAGSIASGPAARAILSYSEQQDVDLVVMGTHGRSGVSRYLIGSVTETVVRNATVPVCCVPMQ